LSEH